jgi:hypothetical protein
MKDMKPLTFTADGFRTTVELIMESINSRHLTPMKKGADWIMADLRKIILKMILDQIKIIFSKTILDQIKIIFFQRNDLDLRSRSKI